MIIVHLKSTYAMDQLAELLLPALGVDTYSMHESLNYPPDFIYFKGQAGSTTFKICGEDDAEYTDFQYWLIVSEPGTKPVESSTIAQIARTLRDLSIGFSVEP